MQEDMARAAAGTEVRHRLRRVGHSFTVTLPSQWIADGGWKRDDVLRLRRLGSDAIIVGKPAESALPVAAVVEAPAESEHLFRELVGAYLQGHEVITVKCPGTSKDVSRAVKEFLRRTATMVVVEEDSDRITLQDVSGVDVPLESRLARMQSLIREMHTTVATGWTDVHFPSSNDMALMDDEVDRVGWQIRRALVRKGNKPIDMPAGNAIPVMHLSRTWEQIGDLAVRISEQQQLISGNPPPKSLLTHIADLHRRTIGMLEQAPKILAVRDVAGANELIDNVSAWEGERTALLMEAVQMAKAKRLPSETLASVSIVLEAIVRMARYLADVAELTMDSPSGSFTNQGKGNMSEGRTRERATLPSEKIVLHRVEVAE